MTETTRTYTTLSDLVDREIRDALDGVKDSFDLDGFVDDLRDRDLIVWDDAYDADDDAYRLDRQGFQLVADEDTFWAIMDEWDRKASHA